MKKCHQPKQEMRCSHCNETIYDENILRCFQCGAYSHHDCWVSEETCAIPGCKSHTWERLKPQRSETELCLNRHEGGGHPFEPAVDAVFTALMMYSIITSPASFAITLAFVCIYVSGIFLRIAGRGQRFSFNKVEGSIESYYVLFGYKFFDRKLLQSQEVTEIQVRRQKILGYWRERLCITTADGQEQLIQETHDRGHFLLVPCAESIAQSFDKAVVVLSDEAQMSAQQDTSPCPVCGENINSDTGLWCADCYTFHHRDCWSYNRGCAVYCCGSRTAKVGPWNQAPTEATMPLLSKKATRLFSLLVLSASAILTILHSYLWLPFSIFFLVLTGPNGPFQRTLKIDGAQKAVQEQYEFCNYPLGSKQVAQLDELVDITLIREIDTFGHARWSLHLTLLNGEILQFPTDKGAIQTAEAISETEGIAIEYIALDEKQRNPKVSCRCLVSDESTDNK